MATLALGTTLTVAELQRHIDPNGKLRQVVDLLAQQMDLYRDATWIECNSRTFHEDSYNVTQPGGAERLYDEGVAQEAPTSGITIEPTCMLAGLCVVDSKKYQHMPNEGQIRLDINVEFLRGMTKTFEDRLWDGNRASYSRRVNGLNNRPYYNTLTSPDSNTYVYDTAGGNASATANKTSMYIVQWGGRKVNLLYPLNDPKSGAMGMPISMRDFGEDLVTDANDSTKQYPAWRTWFEINFGIFIHDTRCIKRIVNISTTEIDGVDDFSFDEVQLIRAYNDLEYNGEGAVIYCNRTIMSQIMERANEKGNAFYTQSTEGEGPWARKVTRFWGIPIHLDQRITNTQDTVTT